MTSNTVKTLFVLCFFAAATSFAQEPSVRWETSFNAAVAQAQRSQKLLFVHVIGNPVQTPQGVDPSRQMDLEVFTNKEVIDGLTADYVAVRVNVNEEPQLAKQFNITALPTDLILQPNGQLVHRRQGSISAVRFSQYLAFLKNTAQTAIKAAEKTPVAAAPLQPQQDTLQDPFTRQSVNVPAVPPQPQPRPAESAPMQSALAAAPVMQAAPMLPPVATNTAPAPRQDVPQQDTQSAQQNTVEVPLALEGYCPVTLCIDERWIPGNPVYCTMYKGSVFRFATPEALTAFAKEPARYIPAVMGEDIVLMVDRNKHVIGNRKFGAFFQNRVFLFSTQETLDAFAAKPEYYADIASKYEMARRDSHFPVVY